MQSTVRKDAKICFNSVQNVRTNSLFLEPKGEESNVVDAWRVPSLTLLADAPLCALLNMDAIFSTRMDRFTIAEIGTYVWYVHGRSYEIKFPGDRKLRI
jgi:hypothetical protein